MNQVVWVRACCAGAAHLLSLVGIDVHANDVEPTYQLHKREITGRDGVDYIALAALHLIAMTEGPQLELGVVA